MSDLKLLTDRLIESKKNEVQEKIKLVEAENQLLISDAAEKLAADKAKNLKAIDSRLEKQFEQDKNSLQINKRNQLLTEKQNVLTTVFNKAEEHMIQWDDIEFQEFLVTVLKQYQSNESIELVLGQNSSSKVTNEWISEVANKLVAIQLSSEVIAKESGFIIKKNGIEYNYLFDELIEDIRSQLVASVSKQLFD